MSSHNLELDQVAAGLEAGEVTSTSLAEGLLEAVRHVPAVFISLDEELLRADAAAADERRKAGYAKGPLDGLPLPIKDNIDVKGYRTSLGSLTRSGEAHAHRDAESVHRLRALGLIPAGKTNLSEFAFSGLGLNPHFGTPALPEIRPLRVPGGSSSGSAIAVAAGLAVAAIGTDTAGSIRVPAAFNGLVGFRASTSRLPMRGVFPLAPSFDTVGPIARSVRDCVWLDAAMRSVPFPKARPFVRPRIVVDTGTLDLASADIVESITRFGHFLAQAGADVRWLPVASLAKVRDATERLGWLGAFEANATLGEIVRGPQRHMIDARVVARLDAAANLPAGNFGLLTALRRELLQTVADELRGGVVLVPTVCQIAQVLAPLEADDVLFAAQNLIALANTMIGSFLDMPGITLPCGGDRADGYHSAMLMAPRGEDDRLLAAASWVEASVCETGRTVSDISRS